MTHPFALIIEDDKWLSDIFVYAVKAAGYEVDVAQDGDVALKRLAARIPDLVVLDLHLPYVFGSEVLRKIRADSRLAKTRIMIATADAALANEVARRGDFVLLKPISVQQMRDLAARLIPRQNGNVRQRVARETAESNPVGILA